MAWFNSSSAISSSISNTPSPSPSPMPTSHSNLATDLKTASPARDTAKVKPCCVCKDEKALRDECMLFSNADDPQEDCRSLVDRYKSCMGGYGFKI